MSSNVIITDAAPYSNYSPYREGSCYHASFANALKIKNPEAAEWWVKNYHSGESTGNLHRRAEAAGIAHTWTDNGDANVLYTALSQGRICAITYKPKHACALIHIDRPYCWNFATEQWEPHPKPMAVIDDPNYSSLHDEDVVPLETFLRRWRSHGGGAVSPL